MARRPSGPAGTPLALVFLVLAVSGSPARADDATPAERAAKVLAAMSPPSPDRAFRYEFALVVAGVPVGTMTFAAEVLSQGDERGWRCTDAAEWQSDALTREEEVVDAHLAGVRGELVRQDPTGTVRATWKRSEGGFAVATRTDDAEPTTREVVAPGFPAATTTVTLLFLRAAPADRTTYEMPVLEPAARDGRWTRRRKVTIEGTVPWKVDSTVRPAWVASVEEGQQTLRLAFDPVSREFLGAQDVNAPVALVPKSAGTGPSLDLSRPATDPKVPALKVALAFAVGDRAMAESAVHWPSVYEAAKQAGETVPETVEAYREAALAAFPAEPESRTLMEHMLIGSLGEFRTEPLEGGRVLVRLPPLFEGKAFETREFDGAWLVVKFPSTRLEGK